MPLGKAIAQDLVGRQVLDVDVTKELRLAVRRPDPCRYRIRPLGLPSGVHVFAMTFERSPIQMEVTSREVGHIFNEPQVPTFQVRLQAFGRLDRRGRLRWPRRCELAAVATDYDGNETIVRNHVPLGRPETPEPVTAELVMHVLNRGYHDLRVELRLGNETLLTQTTSFALLPPDTRQYRDESPFGVRDRCGAHFTPADADIRGPLYVKAGLRYAFKADALEGYGVIEGNDPCVKSGEAVAKLAARVKEADDDTYPKRLLIFHEDHLGRSHHYRTPTFFTKWAPYEFNEQEQAKFERMMSSAAEAAKAIRDKSPLSEIYFGNGCPLLLRTRQALCGPSTSLH